MSNEVAHKASTALHSLATLVTRLPERAVIRPSHEGRSCHDCHTRKISSRTCSDIEGRESILSWLEVVVTEGHIEPSQASVGKIVGWPRRPILKRSLWADFMAWGKREELRDFQFPTVGEFYFTLDQVLDPLGSSYSFPCLATCQLRYSALKGVK